MASRTIVVRHHGHRETLTLEPSEVAVVLFQYREWLADRYTDSSPTIPAVTIAWTPSGSAPSTASLTYTADTVRVKITAGTAYTGVMSFLATLNSTLATEEMKLTQLNVVVADSV